MVAFPPEVTVFCNCVCYFIAFSLASACMLRKLATGNDIGACLIGCAKLRKNANIKYLLTLNVWSIREISTR